MKAIVIGCPGSGKTTFANKLAEKTKTEIFYLDTIWHLPNKDHISRDEFDRRLAEILENENWIIDGNYQRTLEVRLKACDTVFLFDLPTEVCIQGAIERVGKYRPEMPWQETEFDPEFREEIETFKIKNHDAIYSLLDTYKEGRKITIFKSRKEAEEWLNEIQQV